MTSEMQTVKKFLLEDIWGGCIFCRKVDIVSLTHNNSFWAQKLTLSVSFWAQKLIHYVSFWAQKTLI